MILWMCRIIMWFISKEAITRKTFLKKLLRRSFQSDFNYDVKMNDDQSFLILLEWAINFSSNSREKVKAKKKFQKFEIKFWLCRYDLTWRTFLSHRDGKKLWIKVIVKRKFQKNFTIWSSIFITLTPFLQVH